MLAKLWKHGRSLLGLPPRPSDMLGARPDLPDSRDYIRAPVASAPEESVDLRVYGRREPWHQGQVGACSGYSTAYMVANLFGRISPSRPWDPSPLFLYYKAREIDGTCDRDVGAYLRSMMQVLQKVGVAPYFSHPTQTDWRRPPSQDAMQLAGLLKIKDYQRILVGPDAPLEMMRTMGQEKLPLLVVLNLGVSAGESSSSFSGKITVPKPGEKALGPHAVCLDGYSLAARQFYGWNSWGRGWGDGGRLSVPFEYFQVTRLCPDIWSVTPDYW
jgi:hypothetical protein